MCLLLIVGTYILSRPQKRTTHFMNVLKISVEAGIFCESTHMPKKHTARFPYTAPSQKTYDDLLEHVLNSERV